MRPELGVKRPRFGCMRMAQFDPGCVKTLEAEVVAQQTDRTHAPRRIIFARAELYTNQSCARMNRRRVFTQPRPVADLRDGAPVPRAGLVSQPVLPEREPAPVRRGRVRGRD